jgi:hypothetical protein
MSFPDILNYKKVITDQISSIISSFLNWFKTNYWDSLKACEKTSVDTTIVLSRIFFKKNYMFVLIKKRLLFFEGHSWPVGYPITFFCRIVLNRGTSDAEFGTGSEYHMYFSYKPIIVGHNLQMPAQFFYFGALIWVFLPYVRVPYLFEFICWISIKFWVKLRVFFCRKTTYIFRGTLETCKGPQDHKKISFVELH